ncbi:TRAP transporter substrate-binding protein DctP [Thermodesulfobacteriota bacterium]
MFSKKWSIPVVTLVLLLSLLLLNNTKPASAQTSKPVEISYVTFVPKMAPNMRYLRGILNKIEERSQGQLIFKHRGGPEAIPPFDQPMAAKAGAVDAAYIPAGYYAAMVPAAGLVNLSEILPHQERKTGAYEFLQKLHERAGLHYVFREGGPPGSLFTMITNKGFKKPQELAGATMFGGSLWVTVGAALGMKTVMMNVMEGYSALERGLIDVQCSSVDSFCAGKFWDVAKYVVQPTFATPSVMWVMNMKKWNSIPNHLQNLFADGIFELGPQWEAERGVRNKQQVQLMQNKGMKLIALTGADAEWFLDRINGAIYDFYVKKAGDDGPKLHSLQQKELLKR